MRGDINDLRPFRALGAVAEALGVDSEQARWRAGQILEEEQLDSRHLSAVYLQVLHEIVRGVPMPESHPYPDFDA